MNHTSSKIYPGPALGTENAFRLLELQAGKTGDPITVRLLACSFGAVPYEAVSYAWGDSDQNNAINALAGGEDETCATMFVTTNCHNALMTLRKSHEPRVLWVDSICINQHCTSERSQQVSLMAQIYQGARRVVVYLGQSADDSDEAMHWIREIDQPSDYGDWKRTEMPRAPSNLNSIRAIFRRSWFHRVWVLQEIAFAQDAVFVCGQSEVSWDSMRAFRHFNRIERWVEGGLPYPVEYAVRRSHSSTGIIDYRNRLYKLLKKTKHCRATDARDKLYAMLPLLNWEHEKMVQELEANRNQSGDNNVEKLRQAVSFQPDYSQSVQQVYTKLTITLLEHFGLSVLQIRKVPSHVKKLPTWVIDWEAVTNSPYHTQQPFRPCRPRYATPGESSSFWTTSKLYLNEKEPEEQLRVRALRIDKIVFIGDVCDINQDIFPLKQWTSLGSGQKWWHQEPPIPPDITNEDQKSSWRNHEVFTPFMDTLVAGDIVYRHVVIEAIRDITLRDESSDGTGKARLKDMPKGLAASDAEQFKRIFRACDGRRFFITDTGHIGLAPEAASIGDLTFEVQGCRVPYVMRPCPDAGAATSTIVSGQAETSARNARSVTMVGQCWIHGMMGNRFSKGLAIRDCSSYSEDLVIY